jgi:hypothetical protein
MKLEWFIYHKNSVLGPFATGDVHTQIQSGKFSPNSFIWWKGEKDWITLSKWQTDYPEIIKKLEAHFSVEWRVKINDQISAYMSFEQALEHLKLVELSNNIFICKRGDGEAWDSIFNNSIFLNALELTRRKFPRVPIVATAKITKSDSKFSYLVKVTIIGQGGIGISGLGKNFPTGTEVDVRVESPSLTVPIHAEGRIVYHTRDGITGLEFGAMNAESESLIIEYVNRFNSNNSGSSSQDPTSNVA